MKYCIRNRNAVLPGEFLKPDAERIASDLSKSECNGWIYYVIEQEGQ